MNKIERQDTIVCYIEEKKFVSVEELCQHIETTPVTIRRDLAELAQKGSIIRCRGGAKCITRGQIALPFGYRRTENPEIKNKMARAATRFLHDNMVVFVDASSTCEHLTDFFKNYHNLIVITNSLTLASSLKYQNVRVYCLGGEILEHVLATAGPIAIDAARNFCIDLMFFSSFGVNSRGIIIDPAEKETKLRQSILSQATTSVFLCDKSKFDRSATFVLAPLNDIDYFVTDAPVPENYLCVKKEVVVAEPLS